MSRKSHQNPRADVKWVRVCVGVLVIRVLVFTVFLYCSYCVFVLFRLCIFILI